MEDVSTKVFAYMRGREPEVYHIQRDDREAFHRMWYVS